MKKFWLPAILIFVLNVAAAPGAGANGGAATEEKTPVMQFRVLEKNTVKEAFRQEPPSEFRFDTSVSLSAVPPAAATAADTSQWSERLSLSPPSPDAINTAGPTIASP